MPIHPSHSRGLLLALCVAALASSAHADAPRSPTSTASAAPKSPPPQAASEAAEAHDDEEAGLGPPWRLGPTALDLGHDLTIDLPDGYGYLGQPQATELMKRMGNLHNESLLGLIASAADPGNWLLTVRYENEGYIKDDESIDADALLKSIKEGNDEYNKERVEQGFKPLTIGAWDEPPRYDRAKHHLIWALPVSSVGEKEASVNFNTRVLGRRGYASLNLVTDRAEFARHKPEAGKLLAVTHFKNGARYEDFQSGTDKVAEYGLAGLVLGGAGLGAAKLVKVGFLAKFWNVIVAALLAGKKLVVFVVLAIVGVLQKIFGKKSPPQDE